MAARLALDGIGKTYPGIEVLADLDLELEPGAVVSVQGASGTGKSTLLNIAGLLDLPDHGRVVIEGQDVGRLGRRARAALRARGIGFVFQGFHLLPEFDVLENVLMPARCAGLSLGRARERARMLLERVGLAGRLHAAPTTLSGGEAQRVALCRAVICDPPLLLADEPTGNLDPGTAAVVLELLLELVRERDAAMLLVTHDPAVAARGERILDLHAGRLHLLDERREASR